MSADLASAFAPLAATTPVLLVISAIDARTYRIPDRLSYPLFAFTAIGMVALAATVGAPRHLAMAMVGSILFTAVLGLLHVVRPDGLGLGDVKLAASLGLLAGWGHHSTIDVAMTVIWSVMLASAIGLAAMAGKRVRGTPIDRSTVLPFGPALCAGTVLAAIAAAAVTP